MECKCNRCKNACKNKPGWFIPEQIPKLLEYFSVLNIRELFKNGFAIDWWVDDNDDILVLAPQIIGNSNIEYPKNPHGVCVFYKNGICSIHNIKPFECYEYMHSDENRTIEDRKEKIKEEWKESKLLLEFKGEIIIDNYSIFDIFD